MFRCSLLSLFHTFYFVLQLFAANENHRSHNMYINNINNGINMPEISSNQFRKTDERNPKMCCNQNDTDQLVFFGFASIAYANDLNNLNIRMCRSNMMTACIFSPTITIWRNWRNLWKYKNIVRIRELCAGIAGPKAFRCGYLGADQVSRNLFYR